MNTVKHRASGLKGLLEFHCHIQLAEILHSGLDVKAYHLSLLYDSQRFTSHIHEYTLPPNVSTTLAPQWYPNIISQGILIGQILQCCLTNQIKLIEYSFLLTIGKYFHYLSINLTNNPRLQQTILCKSFLSIVLLISVVFHTKSFFL